MIEHDKDLIVGALDSLGVALADHQHQWTDGERAIYEESIKTLWNMAEQYRQSEQQLAAELEKVQTLVDLALAIEPHLNRLNAVLKKYQIVTRNRPLRRLINQISESLR